VSATDPARIQLAEQIATDHPAWVVQPFPYVPKQVAKGCPVVSVWRTDLEREGLNLVHRLQINLYCSKTAGPDAETEAEDLLDKLLTSIQRLGLASWGKAERTVFDKVLSGWLITGQVRSTDIYKTAVLTERGTDNGA
jgi:hypothetical protein